MRNDIYLVKAVSYAVGTIIHKFGSLEEIADYIDETNLKSCEIIRRFENLSFEDFKIMWHMPNEELLNLK